MDPQQRRSLRWFWAGVVFVVFGLYSAGVAIATINSCDDTTQRREWQWMPPAWECLPVNQR